MSQAREHSQHADKLFALLELTDQHGDADEQNGKKIYSEVLGSQLWKHLMGLELKRGVFKLTASSETNVLPPLRYQPRPLSSRTPLECCCPWLLSVTTSSCTLRTPISPDLLQGLCI